MPKQKPKILYKDLMFLANVICSIIAAVSYSVARIDCASVIGKGCVASCTRARCDVTSFATLQEARLCLPEHCSLKRECRLHQWTFPACADPEKGTFALRIYPSPELTKAWKEAHEESQEGWISFVLSNINDEAHFAPNERDIQEEDRVIISRMDTPLATDTGAECTLPEAVFWSQKLESSAYSFDNVRSFSLSPLLVDDDVPVGVFLHGSKFLEDPLVEFDGVGLGSLELMVCG
eukprot:Protomagalhaensia_wolfi_Nauph_80__5143@NODE_54_length_4157_cov_100_817387_g45_i0_p3_GENE_NODE_54_length_4157_cov_100_817387_g45_i0NODE_54_length_4157_cov_100_817387_g45_i0_p3_ORF_typecomplete_len235_score22_04_NODE_54_length_4157_cov_100_817387_g45_i0135839